MIQTVLIVCGSCCLLIILASCLLSFLAWILRNIRPKMKKKNTPVPDEPGDVLEGEYREIVTKKGEG